MLNFQAFCDSLPIMSRGMGGIFAVILVLMLFIVLLRKIFPEPVDKTDQ